MILKALDQKIRNAFSSAAGQYDGLTSLHKEIGRELSKKVIDNDHTDSILDVGMGTGWLSHRLKFYLPASRVIGMDFAGGMIEEAKKKYDDFIIVQADANSLPFKEKSFDLIISNLAYQWVKQLDQAFVDCQRILKEHGKMYITMFGHETLNELFESINSVMKKERPGETLTLRRLASVLDVQAALSAAGFKDVRVDYERIKVRFNDLFDLIKWVKGIGANCLGNSLFLGKDLLDKANQYYCQKYSDRLGVYATLEVIWIKADK